MKPPLGRRSTAAWRRLFRFSLSRPAVVALGLATMTACSQQTAGTTLPRNGAGARRASAQHKTAVSQLKHIVVVIQENRSPDNMFNGFCLPSGPCADTVTVDPVTGQPLAEESIGAPFGISHSHRNFVLQFDGGAMDGFVTTKTVCKKGAGGACPYGVLDYVPQSETPVYRQLATDDGVLSDATFQTNQGPSFPAHLYAIAGQSGGYDDDHWALMGGQGTCGTQKPDIQILMTSPYPGQTGNKQPPCKDFLTIFDLLANAGHTWRYYSDNSGGFFSPTQDIEHLYNSSNFIVPSTQFLTDIQSGTLADVTYVIPWEIQVSDHPGNVRDPEAGQEWVGSVVNAVGESPFWNSTAVVVWWDDWGGLYDHVVPPAAPVYPDPFEYGFRVPLMVISPFARVGTIDHTTRTFVSALRLIEETFSLPSLGTTDQYEPDGLDSMFDFDRAPRSYVPVGGSRANPRTYRAHHRPDPLQTDNDDG